MRLGQVGLSSQVMRDPCCEPCILPDRAVARCPEKFAAYVVILALQFVVCACPA